MFQSNLHWALAGAGRGGGRGSSGSLGKQGLASKLIGTVLSSWTRLLNSHFCCSCCRSLLIWTKRKKNRFPIHSPYFLKRHFNAKCCSIGQGHAIKNECTGYSSMLLKYTTQKCVREIAVDTLTNDTRILLAVITQWCAFSSHAVGTLCRQGTSWKGRQRLVTDNGRCTPCSHISGLSRLVIRCLYQTTCICFCVLHVQDRTPVLRCCQNEGPRVEVDRT